MAAEHVLLDNGHPVTVLGPSKITAKAPRGRANGCSSSGSSTGVLPSRSRAAARGPSPDCCRQYHGVDRTVARRLDHRWHEILLDDESGDGVLGRHPWDRLPPIALDTAAAQALGHVPAGDYATTISDEIDRLVGAGGDPRWVHLDTDFFSGLFDYAAEGRCLAGLRR